MRDDDWGFFIDLELDPIKKEKDKHPKKKENLKIYSNNLSVIYEEEMWYQRDENDDTDYKKGTETWECSEEKEKKTSIGGCIDKSSIIIYCVICASFISLSILL
jgi:hypothetical protein